MRKCGSVDVGMFAVRLGLGILPLGGDS